MNGYTVIKLDKQNGATNKVYYTMNKNEACNFVKQIKDQMSFTDKKNLIIEIWRTNGAKTEVISSFFYSPYYLKKLEAIKWKIKK